MAAFFLYTFVCLFGQPCVHQGIIDFSIPCRIHWNIACPVSAKYPDGATIGRCDKTLIGLNLFPSENHSVYSLRHSFQDRLTALSTPDRVQVQLMGHSFKREDYGLGATLKQKIDYMEKICLKNDDVVY